MAPPRSAPLVPMHAPDGPSSVTASYFERARDIVFRTGPVPLALVDWNGRILHANRAYERLFGWPVADLRRMNYLDYTYPEDAAVGIAEVRALRRGEVETARFEKRYVARDGRMIWARVKVFALCDDAGEFVCTAATVYDITEVREAQRRAEDWRRRYDTAILASRQVLYDRDIATGETVWAGACESQFGYRVAEMGDVEAWRSRIHPDDLVAVGDAVARAIHARTDVHLVYRFRHRAGHWLWVEDSAYFVEPEGRHDRMIGFLVDVTERVRAEEIRRRKEQTFQLAAAAINGLIWEWDPATDLVWRSEHLQQLIGLRPDELEPTPAAWRALVHPDDLPLVDRRSVDSTYESEYRMRHGDGRWITVWERAVVERDAQGRAQRIVGATVDITERRLAASEIRRMNAALEDRVAERTEELTHANRELEAFTYSVSHDLRAPLRHVAGFAELLRQRAGDTLDAESRRYLDVVLASSARMGDLLDRLLEFSRLARAPLDLVALDPGSLARDVAAELAPAPPRRVDWRIGRLPAVHADYALLRIVFENLLSNAAKYSAERSPAVIAVRADAIDGGFVRIEIEDNGIGFDMRYADRLFGVFERLHPTDRYEGWGVGLASVQRIVLRHGGRVDARGEPGRGATFAFTLPAARSPP